MMAPPDLIGVLWVLIMAAGWVSLMSGGRVSVWSSQLFVVLPPTWWLSTSGMRAAR